MVKDFLTYIRAEKRYSDATAAAYERDIDRFVDFVGGYSDFDPSRVTPEDIRMWIIELSGQGLSPSSINRMVSSLRSFFRYCRKKGVVKADLFLKIKTQKLPVRLPVYVAESKIDDMFRPAAEIDSLDFVRLRDQVIVTLFYTTGIRLAELLSVSRCNFNNNFSEIKIRGKGNKERVVPVIKYTSELLETYFRRLDKILPGRENAMPSFVSETGKPIARVTIYRIVKRHLENAGIQGKTSPHVLRHTFATHLLNAGADIKEIQELLGHNSLAATQVYTHNNISRLKEVYSGSHPRGKK